MNLNILIKKIEKYLGRELEFSMKEFKQLQLLRADILKIEELLKSSRSDSAILIEHFKKKTKKEQRYIERIERRYITAGEIV